MININFLDNDCFSRELFDQIIINLDLVFSSSENKIKNLLTLNFSRFNLAALIKWVDERSKDKFFTDHLPLLLITTKRIIFGATDDNFKTSYFRTQKKNPFKSYLWAWLASVVDKQSKHFEGWCRKASGILGNVTQCAIELHNNGRLM